jgi:membrane protease YdiL (CAAX protease family)
MEEPSGPEKPQFRPTLIKPPGLEMARGLLLFSLVFLVFMFVQMAVLVWRVFALTPSFAQQGFSMAILDTQPFLQRWRELSGNGDVLSVVSLLSGLAGLALLLIITYNWKLSRTWQFLALRPPTLRPVLTWTGLFIVLFAALQALSLLFPEMNSDFMAKALASVTNYPVLILGMGIVPAVFEEFLLRGLLYGSLRHLLDKHVSIAIVAGIFTLIHQQYDWHILLLYVLPMGVFLGYARANTGSIWTGDFLHMLNNCVSMMLPQGHGG